MSFDVIVFSQNELDNALENGIKNVCICDGSFIIPLAGGVTYTAIGGADAVIYTDKRGADELGIVFDGFAPVFKPSNANISVLAHSYGTSASSFASSYFMSSFMTSYIYGYSYNALRVSYTSSYSTSYVTSYMTSYVSSYAASRACEAAVNNGNDNAQNGEVIMVNGYGINLI